MHWVFGRHGSHACGIGVLGCLRVWLEGILMKLVWHCIMYTGWSASWDWIECMCLLTYGLAL